MFQPGKRGTMRGGDICAASGMPQRVILHVDMDAFYAQVEQLLRPELRGKSVIVGLGDFRRGVVTACSYEARAFGVKAGMPGLEAIRLCPDAIVVRGSMDSYTYFSGKVREVFSDFTPIVEPASIDEAYLDVTGCMRLHTDAVALAASVKAEMRRRLSLICSVGVSVNKHLAKVASALEKPDGLTTMWPHELRTKLFPLDVSKLYGVGPVATRNLNSLGIYRVGDLAEAPVSLLKTCLGSSADHFKKIANGQDNSPLHTHDNMSSEKSISHSKTFSCDTSDIEYLRSAILHLSDKVVSRMKGRGFLAATVSLKVRFADFTTITRDRSFRQPTDDIRMVYRTACDQLPEDRVKREKVRLLGVRVANLSERRSDGQSMLFNDSLCEKHDRAACAVEYVRAKFGKSSIIRAGSLVFVGKRPR